MINNVIKSYSQSSVLLYEFIIPPSDFFSDDGVVVFHHFNSLMPLILPHELIKNICLNDKVNKLFDIERFKLGMVTIEYIFQQDDSGARYDLFIRLGCKKPGARQSTKLPKVYLDICIASFDYLTVHSFAKCKFSDGNYSTSINFNEFLLTAIYGSRENKFGLPGSNSFDLSAGQDLHEEKSLVCPIDVEFIGLYSCWIKKPGHQICYNHRYYNEKTSHQFQNLAQHGIWSNLLSPFFVEGNYVRLGLDYFEIKNDIMHTKKILCSRVKNTLSESEKVLVKFAFKELSICYESLIGAINLLTGIDYYSAVELVNKYLLLPHPYLLKTLYDYDFEKFILYIKDLSQLAFYGEKLLDYVKSMTGFLYLTVKRHVDEFDKLSKNKFLDIGTVKYSPKDSIETPTLIHRKISRLKLPIDNSRNEFSKNIAKKIDNLINVDLDLLKELSTTFDSESEETENTFLSKIKKKSVLSTNKYELIVFNPKISPVNNTEPELYAYQLQDACRLVNKLKTGLKNIYLAEPCLVEHFTDAFLEIIEKKLKKASIGLILIPVLVHVHWQLMICHINYEQKQINILWESTAQFFINKSIKNFLKYKIENKLINWFKEQCKVNNREISINYCYRNINCEKHITDSGPIIFHAIESYINTYNKNNKLWSDIENCPQQILPNMTDYDYKQILNKLRAKHTKYWIIGQGANNEVGYLENLAIGSNNKKSSSEKANLINEFYANYLNIKLAKLILIPENKYIEKIMSWRLSIIYQFIGYVLESCEQNLCAFLEQNALRILNVNESSFNEAYKKLCKYNGIIYTENVTENITNNLTKAKEKNYQRRGGFFEFKSHESGNDNPAQTILLRRFTI